jgi:hypothetical protein
MVPLDQGFGCRVVKLKGVHKLGQQKQYDKRTLAISN